MKICPTCDEVYKDDEINFCLADGSTLLKKRDAKPKKYSRMNEVAAVALVAIAILIFLCLVTYSASDWSFNTASSQRTQNWIGIVGAVIADILFQAIGISAYIFPALIGLVAWRVFHAENLRPKIGRVVGFVLFVCSVSGIIHLIVSNGGLLGAFFLRYSANLLGFVGATILLASLLLVSMILLADFTFVGFLTNFKLAWSNLRLRFTEWRAKHGNDPIEQAAKARERSEKRKEIRDGKTGELPPTIAVGETIPIGKVTSPDIAAKTVIGESAIGELKDEEPPPTIAVPETLGTVNEAVENGSGPIPITPIKQTGDLDENVAEPVDEEPEEIMIPQGKPQNYDRYMLPHPSFLTPAAPHIEQKEAELLDIATELVEKTKEFNVTGRVVHITQGPVVTTYEFKPDPGVKYSRVTGLVDDLCLALKAESIRIDRIPGKAFVGIEVPNRQRETIQLREVIESKKFRDSHSLLTIALGKTIDGLNYVTDLTKMPHLLIAGATGAGKSVGVNSLVVSILYKAKPDEVKFIMVDPKRLELGLYADIPHLATPIITDPKRAAVSLRWAVSEMERRYKDLAGWGVRNIDGYNAEVKGRNSAEHYDDNGEPFRPLPYIVIIIDELADLMMVSGKDVEEAITRLAQMARAVGIHLVLATQRPSVDVITGLIKANFPSRISFRVSSKVDSRTIIDANGAEGLLGKGDMLFLPPGNSQVVRVHGAFVDEKEISRVVEHIKGQGRPEYDTTITKTEEELDDSGELPGRKDPLFLDALRTVVGAKRASTSLLQRHLRIGYGRAAAILDAMVREGYIGEMDGSTRARPILQKAYEDLQDLDEMESV
jgi:DNA segregation ATPase FtsK/SpoIIIE and related proteins